MTHVEKLALEWRLGEPPQIYELALSSAGLGVWEYRLDTGEVFWDELCRHMYGIGAGEQVGYANAVGRIHVDDRQDVDRAVKQAISGANRGAYHHEYRVVWPDASVHWIASHGRVLFEGDPQRATRFVGVNLDITQSKSQEVQLQRLNRTLEALTNSNQAMLQATCEPELLQQVCRIVTQDCGYSMVWIGMAENDENQSVRPVAHAGFEEGYLETLKITWADTERGRGPTGTAIRTGQTCACPNMLTDPKFAPWREQAIKRGYASSVVVPIMAEDRAFGAISIYSREPNPFSRDEVKLLEELAGDLSFGLRTLRLRAAHEQNREWLRVTLNSIGDAVLTSDAAGVVTFLNPVAEKLTGWTTEEVLGRPIQDVFRIVNEKTGEPAADIVARVLRERRTAGLANSTALVSKDGRHIPIEDSAAPILDAAGNLVGVVVVFFDVTEQRRAREALLQSEKLASVGRLALGIAHEINNPLGAVMNSLFLARTSPALPPSIRQYLDIADEELGRVAHIARQSLGFYRESAKPAPVSVHEVLDSALDLLKNRLRSRNIEVRKRYRGDLHIKAVSGELRQVFSNLLANSLDAIGENGIIVVHAIRTGHDRVRVSIADTGKGIDPAIRLRIFDALFTTKEGTGTGLGLWVAQQLVAKHGGSILLRSRTNGPRRGTVFTVVLPTGTAAPTTARAAGVGG